MSSNRGISSNTSPERLWAVVSRPGLWPEWSPYVRGAEGLGSPEVQPGSHGKVVLVGGIRLPAKILEVEAGRSWTWQVGGIIVEHQVMPAPEGSRLAMPVRPAGGLWKPAAMAYAPMVKLIARRIVRVAERES